MFTLGAFTSHEIMIIFYCVKVFGLEILKRFMKRQSFKKALFNKSLF